MNSLFDNTTKFVKFIRNQSKELKIRTVLNPSTRIFIDEQSAIDLGIIFNGYYRNNYGGLIPLHIAASQGFIQYATDTRVEIEYHSKQYPIIANLIIHHVYDSIQQCMISCQQAIDKGYLNLELFSYSYMNTTMAIHEAFNRGLIMGELRTKSTESKPMIYMNEKYDNEFEDIFSSLTNIINSLSEFRNSINISNECELTTDGYIRHRKTGQYHLLTQAIQHGLVSIKDTGEKYQIDDSINNSTQMSDIMSPDKNGTYFETEVNPYFSDTFILDLLTTTTTTSTSKSTYESQQGVIGSKSMKRFLLPVMNSC